MILVTTTITEGGRLGTLNNYFQEYIDLCSPSPKITSLGEESFVKTTIDSHVADFGQLTNVSKINVKPRCITLKSRKKI